MESLHKSAMFLGEVLQHVQADGGNGLRGGGEDGGGLFEESKADIFALEDACSRALGMWEKVGKE